ncbi:MAG: bifunctional adenosylcobinamide kinase/adenosylcobinamide-phosphate guanylyltransferase [Huintestinicola sp.]|uniref:bifunctional adenosylcobinamide kinase/adenosylcobinamide-phosphate guanylyltransferase n=1 Tax=Huintestinicola sp. TaxID=2981661 RepID=UPI003F122660
MILIIGGAYQGKTDHARSLGISDICSGASEDMDRVGEHSAVNDFHLLIKRQLEAGLDPLEEAEKLLEINPDIVIISTEIGGGIVPMEKSERIWREAVGKTCCFLAQKSSRVVRVICGIPTIIKETGDNK